MMCKQSSGFGLSMACHTLTVTRALISQTVHYYLCTNESTAHFYSETIRNLRKRETNCYRLSLKLIFDREHGLRVYKSAFCSKGRHGSRVIFSALTVALDVSLFVSELLNLVSSVTSLFAR
jgi:hypothetical protein